MKQIFLLFFDMFSGYVLNVYAECSDYMDREYPLERWIDRVEAKLTQ